MAESKPIQSEELIEKGIFTDAKKEAKELNTAIEVLTLSFSELVKIQKDGLANIKKIGGATDAKSLKATQEELNKVTEARKKAQEVDKVRLEFTKKFEAQRKQEFADFQKQKKNSDEYIKAQAIQALTDKVRISRLKAVAIEQSKQVGLEQRLLATNARLRLDRAALTGLEADYKEQLTAINDQLDKNNALIKENSDKQKQQSLTVGDYKNQIKEALAETTGFGKVIAKVNGFVNAFEETLRAQKVAQAEAALATNGDTIAHERNIAAIKAEEAATQKLSLAKRAFNAITSPAGLALLAVAAFAALAKAVYDVNQAFQDTVEIGKAFAQDKFWGTGQQFQILIKATIALRKEIGGLELDLQELNDTAGDLTEISNDETLALGKRIKTAEEASQARVEAAKQELLIAERQKELTDLALKAEESRRGVGVGNARQEFYDKQVEAQKRLFDATDKLGDLERTNAQDLRKRNEQRIVDEIELIRSKKLGADSAVETLKKQVDDENTILTNRRASFAKLESEQLKAQNEEIRLLTQFGLKKSEIEDLIATRDAVALQRKLVALQVDRLSVGQLQELAKVVTETQKNELDRGAQKAKIDEKEIENRKEILKINKEIEQINLDRAALEDNEALLEAEKNTNALRERSLSKTFLFNRKAKKATLDSIKEESKLAVDAEKSKIDAFDNGIKNKIDAIRSEINAETKERAIGEAEITKIQTEAQIERDKMIEESIGRATELQTKQDQYLKKLTRERTIDTLNQINQVTEAFSNELNKRNALESKQADRAISKQESTIDKQRNLAERGLNNTLAFEEQKREEMELANRDREERNAKIQEALQLAQTFNAFLQAALKQTPAPTGVQAITQATTNTFLAKGIAKGLVQFAADGNNMIEGAGTTTSDSIPFMLSKKEAVVKASENIKHNDAVVDLNAGVFGKKWMPIADLDEVKQKSTAQNIASSLAIQNNNEIKQLLADIKNKPVQMVNVDQLGQLVETVYKEGVKKVTTHAKSRPRV